MIPQPASSLYTNSLTPYQAMDIRPSIECMMNHYADSFVPAHSNATSLFGEIHEQIKLGEPCLSPILEIGNIHNVHTCLESAQNSLHH